MINFNSYFSDQIEIQERAIKSFRLWIVGLVLLGIGIFSLTFLIRFEKSIIADVTRLGAGFVSVISAFPFREILLRRERIITYKHLKHGFEDVNKRSKEYQMLLQVAIDAMKETMKR